jgi:TATA-box binding protein (TBP) (component of TFIID and TFIIIB)
MEKAQKIDKELADIVCKINASTIPHENCKITTMTILVILNYNVHLETFLRNYHDHDLNEWKIKPKSGFLNCILLHKKTTTGTVAVKLFSNGNLHITGVRYITDALVCSQDIIQLLDNVFDINVYEIVDFDVQLMNSCLKFTLPDKRLISLKAFHSILLDSTPHLCIFNNDQHAGLRIKVLNEHCHKTSIIVFESGNVLINAFVTATELFESFSLIANYIQTHSKAILNDAPDTHMVKCKKDFDYKKYIVLK